LVNSYNSGAKDWKYNNDYVDRDDVYRHSLWLSFMEKRLKLAQRLLNPDDSVLIVTIDEKEVLRLGLLLEQIFKGARIQMVSTYINPAAVARAGAFGRVDEYIFFVKLGIAAPQRVTLTRDWVSLKGRTHKGVPRWDMLRRSGESAARSDRPGCFYPIYIDPEGPKVVQVGDALPKGVSEPEPIEGLVPVLPIRKDGSEGRWQWFPKGFRERLSQGRVRITGSEDKGFVVSILKDGEYKKVLNGEFDLTGYGVDGSIQTATGDSENVLAVPGTQWRIPSHDATQYGSRLLSDSFLPGRKFPFPKSLYAVEDTLRFFVKDKPNALIIDFFAGSGTTAHATMRLNRQYGGQRRTVLVTNNEVAAAEQQILRAQGLHPGDEDWEALGIFEYVTTPRIRAAITGQTPEGGPVKGEYRIKDFSLPDPFPMADGFEENARFFNLTYLDPELVEAKQSFDSIAHLLWLIGGAEGPVVEKESRSGWALPDGATYGVLFRNKGRAAFAEALKARTEAGDPPRHVFIVADSTDEFHRSVDEVRADPAYTTRLYRSYLKNFRTNVIDLKDEL
jgi:adenine-specific DNA-methyltransferase